jgi:sugar transferase (PEP-CTERM system associated)
MLRIFRHYVSGLSLVWLAGDLAVTLAVFSAVRLMVRRTSYAWQGEILDAPRLLLVSAVTMFVLHLGNLYSPKLAAGRREMIARLLTCQTVAALIVAVVGFALPALRFGRASYSMVLGGSTLGLILWRTAWLGPWSHRRMRSNLLVLGTGPLGRAIAELEETGARPFRIVGFLDDDPGAADSLPEGHQLLGKFKDLPAILGEAKPDLIVVAQNDRRGSFPTKALLECRLRGIGVEDWPTFYEKETGKILVSDLRPSWLIFSDGFVKTPRTEIIKRCVDMVLSLAGLTLALPLMILVAIAIKLESRGPLMFRQTRLGESGRVFVIYKFRSMRADAEKEGGPQWATAADPRITRVGRLIRRTRFDELPQLFNVLIGDMSFIGPRPERPEFVDELEKHLPFYRARLSVKPGITGWAQVRYPYGASVEDALEKLQYDLYYIKNLSLFLDLLILLNTMQVVLFARGR